MRRLGRPSNCIAPSLGHPAPLTRRGSACPPVSTWGRSLPVEGSPTPRGSTRPPRARTAARTSPPSRRGGAVLDAPRSPSPAPPRTPSPPARSAAPPARAPGPSSSTAPPRTTSSSPPHPLPPSSRLPRFTTRARTPPAAPLSKSAPESPQMARVQCEIQPRFRSSPQIPARMTATDDAGVHQRAQARGGAAWWTVCPT
jgi:hypothetical protein